MRPHAAQEQRNEAAQTGMKEMENVTQGNVQAKEHHRRIKGYLTFDIS